MNAFQLLKHAEKLLDNAGIEFSSFEARCLAQKVLKINRTAFIADGDREVPDEKLTELDGLVQRRINREPLQYILGSCSFFGYDFIVGEGVLIPRDDTEVVVNLCLDFLKSRESKKTLDLCAGSGAISVALQKAAGADVTGIEKSDEAFEYFKKNIALNHSGVKAVKGDIFECRNSFEDEKFDLIVSNPPYIKTEDIPALQAEVQSEPKAALDGGADGFDFYREIVNHWSAKLKPGGALAFELGEEQAHCVCELMKSRGYDNIKIAPDLGGIQRAIIGTLVKK